MQVRTRDGRVAAPPGARPRALLARLALSPGTVVSSDALADALWGERPPGPNALHTVVSRVRRGLAEGDAGVLLESGPAGYALAVAPDDVDATRAERLADQARERLAAGRPEDARELAETALALWRGDPLADVGEAPFAAAAAARLAELRLQLHETAIAARLAVDGSADLAAVQALADAHPLRERLQGLLMRALSTAGRQADALAVYERTRRALADELGVDPSPELQDVHVAVLRQDGLARPGDHTDARPHTNLRAQLTSFVGREDDVDRLIVAVASGRLTTVVGPGGAGKTRLATETAAHLAHAFRDGAYLVELAPVHDPDHLPQVVFTVLGLRSRRLFGSTIEPDTLTAADVVELLVDNLSGAELLLILDNCEHVVEAAAALTDTVLAACPDVRIVATSREPLGITGEKLHPLGPLALPPPQVSAADATSYASVQLFADRAAAVRPDFSVDGDADAVASICRGLDGLPLAIELAAARTRAMSVRQIADRLDDRFRLLTGGSRTALPRHQTLAAVVDWSWDLLDKPERLLLQRLSVFSAAATLADAEDVCADDELPREDVLGHLTALVDKSLVDPVGDTEIRYRLLETIRVYAADRLAESGDERRMRDRHARHMLAVARQAEPLLRTADQLRWITRLDGLRDDLFAALRWSVDRGDARTAIGLAASLTWYWAIRGMNSELGDWPKRALAVPGESDPVEHALARAIGFLGGAEADDMEPPAIGRRLRAVQDEIEQLDSAAAHPFLAIVGPAVHLFSGEIEQGVESLGRIIDGTDDPWTAAMARLFRSRMAENLGWIDMTVSDEDAMLAAYEEIGDRWGLAMGMIFRAGRLAQRGDRRAAIEMYGRAIEYERQLGANDDIAQSRVRLAELHALCGEFAAARESLDEARRIAERFGSPQQEAFVDLGYADLAFREGDLDMAHALAEAALAKARRSHHGPPQLTVMFLVALARYDVAAGRLAAARAWLDRAYGVMTREPIPDTPMLAQVVESYAALAVASGDPESAARLLGACRSLLGSPYSPNLDHDTLVRQTCDAVGERSYDRLFAEGAALEREAALAWIADWTGVQTRSGGASVDGDGDRGEHRDDDHSGDE
ncbi:MAG TPA: BTAD domain-containing putative transcriptional regulator [Streptosporangiales bacterium]